MPMSALFIEKSVWPFVMVTVLFGGGAAFMTGRAMARGWQSFWVTLYYMLLLGAAIRFLHHGLFADATLASWRAVQGDLFSLHYYITDTLVLIVAAALGYRLERVRQMTQQYRWLYERTSPFTWAERSRSEISQTAPKPD
jgi:hypothetical protein